jgi:RNase adaptor protein for sRNA GlmZ degradation
MDEEGSDWFHVHDAPNGKFYMMTRRDQPICTQTGLLRYFETERDALEFLAEIDDTVLH